MNLNRLAAATLATFAVVATTANATAPNKKDGWDWRFVGDVKDPPRLFPGTRIAKFRDSASGVICYIYTNQYVDSRDINVGGTMQDGVAGNQLGTMSCVGDAR